MASNPQRVCLALGLVCGLAVAPLARAEESTPPLSLADAVRVAQQNHLALSIAAAQLDSSEAGLKIARAGRLPVVTGTSSASTSISAGSRTAFLGPEPIPLPADQTQDIFSTTLSLRETFYDNGLTSARTEAAKAGLASSTYGYEAARQDVTLGVILAYFGYLEALRLHEVAQEQVSLAQRHLEATQASIDAGVLALADIYPFRARLANARITEIQARNNVRQAATALRSAMGLDLGPPPLIAEEDVLRDPGLGDLPVADLVARALEHRPELQQARESTRSAAAGRRQAYINSSPRFTVSGSASWQPGTRVATDRPGDPKVVSQSHGTDYGAAVQYVVPLFDFGVSRAEKQQADSNLRAAQLREEQLVRDTAATVESTYLSLVNAREQLDASAASEEQARVALEAAEARLPLGLATPLELIDAQVTHFNAQVTYVRAQYAVQQALARLARAVGQTDLVLQQAEGTSS